MKPHWQYLKYLARHKRFVLVAGLRLGVPLWRLIVHDWSKLLPVEWFAYVNRFFRRQIPAPTGHAETDDCPLCVERKKTREAFDRAWLHHIHANPHHWQHWILRNEDGSTKALEIPETFAREMVADWCGAGRAINGKWDVATWYVRNAAKMQLHPLTARRAVALIQDWSERFER